MGGTKESSPDLSGCILSSKLSVTPSVSPCTQCGFRLRVSCPFGLTTPAPSTNPRVPLGSLLRVIFFTNYYLCLLVTDLPQSSQN